MKIAIASGKGGTGKTTVATNLAQTIMGKVHLIDCDVEEPNSHLFITGKKIYEETVFLPISEIDENKCKACGLCSSFCEFNALVSFGDAPIVFPELCHGCGGCSKICPHNAIYEINREIGIIESFDANKITLTHGKLNVGTSLAPPMIKATKKQIKDNEISVIDAPPGTSCPVVATIKDVDFVVLVTEPTPFGLNDLNLAVEMTRELKLPLGIIINRAEEGNSLINDYAKQKGLKILQEIPEDREIAKAYSNGITLTTALPTYRKLFTSIYDEILSCMK